MKPFIIYHDEVYYRKETDDSCFKWLDSRNLRVPLQLSRELEQMYKKIQEPIIDKDTFNAEKVFLKRDGIGIYYIYNYYSNNYPLIVEQNEADICRQILNYKNGNNNAINYFNNVLKLGLKQLFQDRNIQGIVNLVAVPGSINIKRRL